MLLGLAVTWRAVAAPWIDEATYPYRHKECAAETAQLETPVAPVAALEQPKPQPPGNVQPLFGVFTAPRQDGPGRGEARSGIDLPRGKW
jgi:hypothetical protein